MDTNHHTTNRPTSPFTKWLIAAAGAVLLLGAMAGIVAAQEDDGPGSDSSEQPSEEERDAYRECLEENGVELPDRGERPERGSFDEEDREAFREARQACADLHPFADEIEAFRECMADNGVDLPEPGEDRPDRDDLTEEDREAFREAREACADVAPGLGRGPGCDGPRGPGGFGPGHRRGPFGPGDGGQGEGGDDEPSIFDDQPEDALLPT